MQISVPEPLHGWRTFIGEVGIIVLGVLIALGASQVVEAWQWRKQVQLTTETFKDELGGASSAAYVRLAEQPCISDRIKAIEKKLGAPSMRWEPLSLRDFPTPVIEFPFTTEGWSNAIASGTLNHMPYKQSLKLSAAYAAARAFSADERKERELVAKLAPLRAVSTLSPELRFSMLQTIGELERVEQNIALDSYDLLPAVELADIGLSSKSIRRDNAEVLKHARHVWESSCVKEDISWATIAAADRKDHPTS